MSNIKYLLIFNPIELIEEFSYEFEKCFPENEHFCYVFDGDYKKEYYLKYMKNIEGIKNNWYWNTQTNIVIPERDDMQYIESIILSEDKKDSYNHVFIFKMRFEYVSDIKVVNMIWNYIACFQYTMNNEGYYLIPEILNLAHLNHYTVISYFQKSKDKGFHRIDLE